MSRHKLVGKECSCVVTMFLVKILLAPMIFIRTLCGDLNCRLFKLNVINVDFPKIYHIVVFLRDLMKVVTINLEFEFNWYWRLELRP